MALITYKVPPATYLAYSGSIARQGYLQLTQYAERGWRATFYTTGMEAFADKGSAWECTPSHAIQRAAWEALRRAP